MVCVGMEGKGTGGGRVPVFQKVNTIDNLFTKFYGFQAGSLLVLLQGTTNTTSS